MERMAFRAQTIVADVLLAAAAFALAFLISPVHGPGLGTVGESSLSFGQLVLVHGFELDLRAVHECQRQGLAQDGPGPARIRAATFRRCRLPSASFAHV